jgi:hypothetical protein
MLLILCILQTDTVADKFGFNSCGTPPVPNCMPQYQWNWLIIFHSPSKLCAGGRDRLTYVCILVQDGFHNLRCRRMHALVGEVFQQQ